MKVSRDEHPHFPMLRVSLEMESLTRRTKLQRIGLLGLSTTRSRMYIQRKLEHSYDVSQSATLLAAGCCVVVERAAL